MAERHNASPISLRMGKIFLDGVAIADGVACNIVATPDVWNGRQLGDKTPSSRWLSMAYSGSITRRRSTQWLKEKIAEYKATGRTPEFTIQGYMNDKGSDYYDAHGADLTTAVGCVLTGNITLADLDSQGDVVTEVLTFNAKDVV